MFLKDEEMDLANTHDLRRQLFGLKYNILEEHKSALGNISLAYIETLDLILLIIHYFRSSIVPNLMFEIDPASQNLYLYEKEVKSQVTHSFKSGGA